MIPQVFASPERILKIEGSCLAQNIHSIRTMERAGMRQVACLQEHYQHEGSIHDLCLFEIRRRELAM